MFDRWFQGDLIERWITWIDSRRMVQEFHHWGNRLIQNQNELNKNIGRTIEGCLG